MGNNAMVGNPYSLIAIDVDGTLLTSEKKILPETLLALKRVSDKGVQLSFATGRAFVEMAEFFGLTPMIRYAILYSGAILYDCAMKKTLFKMEIPAALFGDIIQVANKYHGMIAFLTEGESIVSKYDISHMEDFHMEEYQPLYEKVTRQVDDMSIESRNHDSITKIEIYFRTIEDRQSGFQELKYLPLTFAFGGETRLEMNAEGVSKGTALETLAKTLNIPLDQTIAMGDDDNDRSMFTCAGLSVVTSNARADIKEMADMIVPSNDSNGVGEAIDRIFGRLEQRKETKK
ncbi:MAG: HAD family hydrolase [Lachnospiraceae bacterium]|nr:HAD family hydrolase [Lachnospiraceae bacterium]MBR1853219.1 HAD family hydrolase [Lachnospiraceae bacterium]